jgi:copper chaperone NosL
MPKRNTVSLLAAGLLAAIGGLAFVITSARALPTGPVPVAFDKEACGHCHMHIGDPRFVAQLQAKDGHVYNFDDPGCMLRFENEQHPAIHAAYLHDVNDDRWLERSRVAFIHVSPTPMGFGLGAVEVGTPGAIAWEAAEKETEQWASHVQ